MIFLVMDDMVETIGRFFDEQEWSTRNAHFEYLMFEKKTS